ncbi:RHS repeat-associated core domain-containing protein, partial [Joostella sp. CR20]
GQTDRYTLGSISYDKNGNITSLVRNGHINGAATSFGTLSNPMDKLSYTYHAGGNFLVKVSDTGNKNYGFKDGSNTDNDYGRDVNGNLIRDKNKGITNIVYNHLNLPTKVTTSEGSISYFYDATGVKLKKVVSSGATTDYAGNYIYENGNLQFFNHAEGYVDAEGSGYNYVYQYKDHLGNVRLSYQDADNNGSIATSEIVEESNYYPFG